MLSQRLIQLIQDHAGGLAREVLQDLVTNPRTAAFRTVPRGELEERIGALYRNLGNWIGDPGDDAVRAEYEDWGRKRFRQGVPISQLTYALARAKHHLRRYIRDGGVEYSGDRIALAELLPVQLHNLQELNAMVGEFFDRALYYLACGYETEAAALSAPRARVV